MFLYTPSKLGSKFVLTDKRSGPKGSAAVLPAVPVPVVETAAWTSPRLTAEAKDGREALVERVFGTADGSEGISGARGGNEA